MLTILALLLMLGCRGEDNEETIPEEIADFVETPDPDSFIQYLNKTPGKLGTDQNNNAVESSIDNYNDFPIAYYNTIDPANTRTTLTDWMLENGFLVNEAGQNREPACDAVENCCVSENNITSSCKVISTHVRFRNTKDTGYGRDMYLRRTVQGEKAGTTALYIRNFKVDKIESLPYGTLNLDALAQQDNHWQFGVNAIEFSTYPYGMGEPMESYVNNVPACSVVYGKNLPILMSAEPKRYRCHA